MPGFACYRLNEAVRGEPVEDFDDLVAPDDDVATAVGPVGGPGFEAKLYVTSTPPHTPRWAGFLGSGFDGLDLPALSSSGALLIVRLEGSNRHFAFTFGMTGRYLLREGSCVRGYGLRTALNVSYPHEDEEAAARLIAVSSKRHGGETVRSQHQASRATTFEAFDLDRLRDLVGAATCRPVERERWGTRVTGGDAFYFSREVEFSDIGVLCTEIEQAHDREDYKERYGWLDFIQPVTDPVLQESLELEVVRRLAEGEYDTLDLAPPEIIDWTRVESFRLSVDARGVTRPELRLRDFMASVRHVLESGEFSLTTLRSRSIVALNGDGSRAHHWTVWRCITGELQAGGEIYVLDEGDFFLVEAGYREALDAFIDALPTDRVDLPAPGLPGQHEKDYNEYVAGSSDELLLLDRATVKIDATTTAIEICDLLSSSRQLIHVKRHLGSRDLSHLFSQGVVSAELLQESPEFRRAARDQINEQSEDDRFDLFPEAGIRTAEFEVVYAIIAEWNGRRLSEALPFFSKVNLRRASQDLSSRRGYNVSCVRIPSA